MGTRNEIMPNEVYSIEKEELAAMLTEAFHAGHAGWLDLQEPTVNRIISAFVRKQERTSPKKAAALKRKYVANMGKAIKTDYYKMPEMKAEKLKEWVATPSNWVAPAAAGIAPPVPDNLATDIKAAMKLAAAPYPTKAAKPQVVDEDDSFLNDLKQM